VGKLAEKFSARAGFGPGFASIQAREAGSCEWFQAPRRGHARDLGDAARQSIPRSLPGASPMTLQLSIAPLIALIAGILILIVPRMLNYIVAIYLIVIGVLGLLGYMRY
jgi:hypothetical protein